MDNKNSFDSMLLPKLSLLTRLRWSSHFANISVQGGEVAAAPSLNLNHCLLDLLLIVVL